ncbi:MULTISPECIES: ATP-binding protein [unclassified Arcicella]|uniref:ATP-binding protein n=1 Tax=unclassified Arcicella TaxID=2644986 RepID=UPI00285990E9|nr:MULTISPECIES: ATP-binding protein [unclassified Arcicella]MDR6561984.1 putative AAA+ superfamily ATPase [Arcicella sp. BE51]MDR6811855.1 putative AAA+ superfamily ATPase [Arcicella sp. BE140]MDR6822885.1 putative AAA+ superfamily ATPase [Arcicella sp. BE139]
MIHRNIFPSLLEHLSKPQATVITGMRRVGKSTALKYLLTQVPHNNKVYLDLERVENRYLLNQTNTKDIEIGLAIEGIDLSKPAVIALDEIQLVNQSTSVIKFLYDTYGTKFIVTGSSSFYLKNHFSESLAGRKRIFEMYPLDFAEFVAFQGESPTLLKQFAEAPFHLSIYLKWKALYENFLSFGGFPEVVLAETEEDKKAYLRDVINAYIELDIRLLSDFSASDDLYRLVRLLAVRTGSRLDFSKLGAVLGINRAKVKEYISLLEHTYFIKSVGAFTQSLDKEFSKQEKIYLADTGLLQALAQVSSGQVFENAIALQLSHLGSIQYYQKKTGLEIDFILEGKKAIEVKETPTPHDEQILKNRAKSLGLDTYYLVGRHQSPNDFKDFVWGGSLISQ